MRVTNLLRNFIRDRMHAYQEPTREGTARGEAVGFSRGKYHAALLSALTGLSQKSIADDLGISYGVVRKWHVESDFKDAMSANLREFNMFFWTRIRENANELQQILDQNSGDDEAPEMAQYDFESDFEYGISMCRILCRKALDIGYQSQEGSASLAYAVEALRVLYSLKAAQTKAYAKKLGRPKSEAPDLAESSFGARNELILGTDGKEAEVKSLFERAIRFLETLLIQKCLPLKPDELCVPTFVLKTIIQDRNRYELTEGRLKKHGSQKTGKKKRMHEPFL
jgi:hypothetical protein